MVVATTRHGLTPWDDQGVGALYLLDPANGRPLRSVNLGHLTSMGVFGDLAGDGRDELVVDTWDGTNSALRAYGQNLTARGVFPVAGGLLLPRAVCDLDGDGRPEIIATFEPAAGDNRLLILDASLSYCRWETAIPRGRVSQVLVVDLRGDGSRDLLVLAGGELRLLRSQPEPPRSRMARAAPGQADPAPRSPATFRPALAREPSPAARAGPPAPTAASRPTGDPGTSPATPTA